jgi:hypothetical protein
MNATQAYRSNFELGRRTSMIHNTWALTDEKPNEPSTLARPESACDQSMLSMHADRFASRIVNG